jgi:Domain of unknown function (DUF1906)
VRRHLYVVLILLALGLGLLPEAAPASAAAPAATPAWKRLSYGAASFEVPASWPVHDLARDQRRCVRLDQHAVYLGSEGANAECPSRAIGRAEALQVERLSGNRSAATAATRASRLAGQPVRIDPSAEMQHAFVVALDRAGLLLTASFGADPAVAKGVLASVRLAGPGAARGNGRGAAGPGGTAGPSATTGPDGTNDHHGPAPRPRRRPVPPQPKLAIGHTIFSGRGFDTCGAPSTTAMRTWRASSPYRAVGIYIGGAMLACPDGNLSGSWVRATTAAGWRLTPIYVGLQAPCVFQRGLGHIDPARAATQGTQAAADAVNRASRAFGIGRGAPIYFDMEAYDNRQAGCVRTVLRFVNAWTAELRRHGYRSGVYSSAASGVADLVRTYNDATRPDYIWFAHWTGVASTQDRLLPPSAWPAHRRIAQYRGGHNERWGGVTINIDTDQVDAGVVGLRPVVGTGAGA